MISKSEIKFYKTYFQIVGNDITEQKRAEQLVNEELEKLKTLDKLRTDFIYRASHDLKTPLNAVCSATSILYNFFGDFNEKEIDLLDIIRKGGEPLKHLVESIVESFRIEDDALQLKNQTIDLVDLIVNVVDQDKHFIEQRSYLIVLDMPRSLYVKGDPEKLEFVFGNLILNAINNTPVGGKIIISAKDLNEQIEVSISDNGVGLTEEELGRLFTKFGKIERYGQGLDVVTEGSGLGFTFQEKK
ncbi:MAG TPA: HAMP domain-containing sensor histidine kinase [Candidatus Lokiarchaeia archaeon]|nr:HAMP domain-containing sensor histidine kinase [Candidatus Lokiarchaeia archaeon]